jgi:hypothetical protein
MIKILTIITLVLDLMLIVNMTSYNIVTIIIPDASAAVNPINQKNSTSPPLKNTSRTPIIAPSLLNSTRTIGAAMDVLLDTVSASIYALVILIVLPLIVGTFLTYRQGIRAIGTGTTIRPFVIGDLFRVLVAVGVIFTVVLILIYLNALIIIALSSVGPNATALIEILKSFLTIIGTAFASLVAFYFGTRGSQGSNAQILV